MIAYIIQCHTQLSHIPRLIEWLYHPENVFLVSVNPRSTDPFDLELALLGRKNVRIQRSVPVTWGGESFLMATIDGIDGALSTWKSWRFAINLSETDIPLRTQSELFDHLATREGQGVTEHVSGWGPVVPYDLSEISYTSDFEHALATRPDTQIISDKSLNWYFSEVERSPILDARLRGAIHALESKPGEVYCRPLYRSERAAREALFRGSPLFIGRIWFCLSRQACKWIVRSDHASRILDTMKSIYNPDECYFQTALYGSTSPIENGCIDRAQNLRFKNGDPLDIGDELEEELYASDAYFARKLSLDRAPRLLERADALGFSASQMRGSGKPQD